LRYRPSSWVQQPPPPTPVRLRGTVKAKVALKAEVAELHATVDAHGSTPTAGCAPSPPPPRGHPPPLAHPEGGRRNRHSLSTRGSGPAAMLSVPIVPNREPSVPHHRAVQTIAVVTYHPSARRSNLGGGGGKAHRIRGWGRGWGWGPGCGMKKRVRGLEHRMENQRNFPERAALQQRVSPRAWQRRVTNAVVSFRVWMSFHPCFSP